MFKISMFKISLKGLVAHKLRFLASAIAVVLGVAFMTGTGLLTDTVSASFNDLYGDVYKDTDAVVRSTSTMTVDQQKDRAPIDASLLSQAARAKGVQSAEGVVDGYARIVGHNGKALENPNQGAPTLGGNWMTTKALNPWVLTAGHAPQSPADVVIDKTSATKGKLAVGDHTTVLTASGTHNVTVTGIAKFGTSDSPGGATYALFTTSEAQHIVGEPGQFDSIAVTAQPGVSQEAVRDAVRFGLPSSDEAITGADAVADSKADVKEGLSFFNTFMFSFAVVALFVGSFIIYNTFSIVVAQRSREMALLRAIGARRRQVLGSVVIEAAIVGLVASMVGIFAGIGVAVGLSAVLDAFGFGLPSGSLVIGTGKVITGMVMGLVVTVLAALIPALRASRVAPIAALRDAAVDKTGSSRMRLALGTLAGLGGAGALAWGVSGESVPLTGLGGLLVLIGALVLGPTFAGSASRLLGSKVSGGVAIGLGALLIAASVTWVAASFGMTSVLGAIAGITVGGLMFHSGRAAFGMTGVLARSNASRNPKRTSATASALTIGVAIVVFFTVFAASVQGSLNKLVDESFHGDLTVGTDAQMAGGLPDSVRADIEKIPGVQAATGSRMGSVAINGEPTAISGFDAKEAFAMFDFGVSAGKVSDLDANSIAVLRKTADDKGWKVGTTVPVRFLDTGEKNLRLAVIYDSGSIPGEYLLDRTAFQQNLVQSTDSSIYIQLKDGVKVRDARSAVERLVAAYPTVDVMDNTQIKKALGAKFDVMLSLIYVMLTLSILIALMGIANTLSLSVFERTREIGLLRAIGMASTQVRGALRWESAIISMFGTVIGLVVGVGFAWSMQKAMAEESFNKLVVPGNKLGTIVVIAAVAGIIAAIVPARKASRLNVLPAVSSD